MEQDIINKIDDITNKVKQLKEDLSNNQVLSETKTIEKSNECKKDGFLSFLTLDIFSFLKRKR